jgi:hypothetical protein
MNGSIDWDLAQSKPFQQGKSFQSYLKKAQFKPILEPTILILVEIYANG